jgi:hypothetical protein
MNICGIFARKPGRPHIILAAIRDKFNAGAVCKSIRPIKLQAAALKIRHRRIIDESFKFGS